jgi:hypothetical protein
MDVVNIDFNELLEIMKTYINEREQETEEGKEWHRKLKLIAPARLRLEVQNAEMEIDSDKRELLKRDEAMAEEQFKLIKETYERLQALEKERWGILRELKGIPKL